MDDQFQMKQDGTELTPGDVNGLGEVSGLGDDRLLADLLQWPFGDATPSKAILPFCGARDGGSPTTFSTLIVPTGVGNGAVRVFPCRVVIGSRSIEGTHAGLDVYRDCRSGLLIGTGVFSPMEEVTLDPTVGNNRVDLIYARVDIDLDAAPVTREIKSATGSISTQSVSVIKNTTVSLAVAKGTEAASPTRPSLPADADPVFYIPLAYVWLTHPHTSSSTIIKRQVEEVAPRLGMNHGRMGTANAGPCSETYRVGSVLHSNDPWTVAKRPDAYLAPSMGGVVHRWFGFDLDIDDSIAAGATKILDNSIDWRDRLFWSRAQGRTNTSGLGLAWEPTVYTQGNLIPGSEENTNNDLTTFESFGQSFQDDGTGTTGEVIFLTNVTFSPCYSTNSLRIYVDLTTGELKVTEGGSGMRGHVFIWIMASGQMKLGGP